jgi:hypothetical protein
MQASRKDGDLGTSEGDEWNEGIKSRKKGADLVLR